MQKIVAEYIRPLFAYRRHPLFGVAFTGSLALVFIHFYQQLFPVAKTAIWLYGNGFPALATHMASELGGLIIWALVSITGYILFPALYLKLSKSARVRDMGLGPVSKNSLPLYGLFLAGILVPVFFISYSPEFQQNYPFYRFEDGGSVWPHWFIWELFYLLQFVGVEFFFRGFLIHSAKREIGINAVYFAMIPYCMIHFSKPLPECIGSIFAGYILGHLSYKTNSIWGGAFLHMCVALSMDLLSMWHRGLI